MKKNTKFGPEIKRVTLHPLKDDGTIDTDINLYPKTLIDGIVNRDGQLIDIQEKLIAGDNITIEGNIISSTGGGSGTEYVINITELDQLEHPVSQEQGEEIFETQPDCIHLIYNINVDTEELTVHLNGDAYLVKQINLHQEISDPDETKEYENAIVYTLLSDDTLNAIKIEKSPEGEITVNDMAEWNFADIVESLAEKANNNEVVHLAGNETIDGQKTFTGYLQATNGFDLNGGDAGSIRASDALYLNGYKELYDTTNFYDEIIMRSGSSIKSTDSNNGLVLPDTSDYEENKTIATEEYIDEKLIAKQDFPSINGTLDEDSYFRLSAPISSADNIREVLETLDPEFARNLIETPETSDIVQHFDNFGEVWKFERTSENSADITLIVGDIKYTTSIAIEVDAETGDAHIVVGEVIATTLADDATTIHKAGNETIAGAKTFNGDVTFTHNVDFTGGDNISANFLTASVILGDAGILGNLNFVNNGFWNGRITNGTSDYGLIPPDTTAFTADKTIATTDEVVTKQDNIPVITITQEMITGHGTGGAPYYSNWYRFNFGVNNQYLIDDKYDTIKLDITAIRSALGIPTNYLYLKRNATNSDQGITLYQFYIADSGFDYSHIQDQDPYVQIAQIGDAAIIYEPTHGAGWLTNRNMNPVDIWGRIGTLETKVPAAPVADGNYFLKVSVVNGQPTYSWESETAVEDEILEENY